MEIILASASERRKKLLFSFGLKFKIIPSKIDERILFEKYKNPEKLVIEIALLKARNVWQRFNNKDFLIISADTFIVLNGKVMGKPSNRQEAEKMLRLMSNKTHMVLTGLICFKQDKVRKGLEITKVTFKKLSDKQIKDYLDAEVYLDRAGAYGIQDEKCPFVKSYKGSYTNILGLPFKKLEFILKEFGVKIKR